MGPLLVIESTSCYRDYLFSSETPLVIGSTSCYRDHLFLSEGPLVIESTSCYRDHLFLSEGPLVIESTSCYRDHLFLSEGPLVIGSTSCYRKAFLSDRERHSPGNDGLSKEFYIYFFDEIVTHFLDALNLAFVQGQLSNSQRQAVITLIEKKGRDKKY